jgi:glycosyltransferase involved in cell wall biosynthesis
MRSTLFLGYQEDVAPFYAAFDAMMLPSANEGTPVSAIEALAAGRPVVATRVGGVPDVVRDGEDGFLVETGAVDALADRLARLAADPDLRRRMGDAGRARVLPRYSVERLIDDVDLLYRSLLEAAGVRP